VAGTFALAHLDKHRGAIRRAHDQVYFSTTAPGRPIIALKKAQISPLQIVQRRIFSRITNLFGGGPYQRLDLRKYH
jgi:hypothetical protein